MYRLFIVTALEDTQAVLRHRLTGLPGAQLLSERLIGGGFIDPGDGYGPGDMEGERG